MIASKVLRFNIASSVKELRFQFCQNGESSNTIRQYLSSSYPYIKKSNPELPILIREASGVSPTLYVRYEFGKEIKQSLEGLKTEQIETILKGLK